MAGRPSDAVCPIVYLDCIVVKIRQDKQERLCRYITRPAIAERRLSLTHQGKVRYELKPPYRDGTTHVIFEPVDFIAKLAALVPRPKVNLTRLDEGHPCPSPYRQPSVVQIHSG